MTNSITPALIIIDMINDFQFKEGALLAEKAEHLTKPINALRAIFTTIIIQSFMSMITIIYGRPIFIKLSIIAVMI